MEYNYAHFPLDLEDPLFEAFAGVCRVGQRAPGGELVDLDSGDAISLASLWRETHAVLEFGSFT